MSRTSCQTNSGKNETGQRYDTPGSKTIFHSLAHPTCESLSLSLSSLSPSLSLLDLVDGHYYLEPTGGHVKSGGTKRLEPSHTRMGMRLDACVEECQKPGNLSKSFFNDGTAVHQRWWYRSARS